MWQIDEPLRYGFRPPRDPALASQPALVVTPADRRVVESFFETVQPLGTASRRQRNDEVLETVNLYLASGLKDR